MFELRIDAPDAAPDVRERAAVELAEIRAVHAEFRAGDLRARRDYLRAHQGRIVRGDAALLQAELHAVEQRIVYLQRMHAEAARHAPEELRRLLRFIGSFVEGLDLGSGCLAARIRTHDAVHPHARMLLVPRRERAARVRRQIYAGDPPAGVEPSSAPCMGVPGNGYVDDALDRMDLASLVMTFVSHVRTNI
jgi:hypothetical protein